MQGVTTKTQVLDGLSEIAVSFPAFWGAYMLGMPPGGAFVVGVGAMSILVGYHRGDFAFKGNRRSQGAVPLISVGNALFLLQCVALAQWAFYLNGQDAMLAIKVIVGFAFVEALILAGRHAWLMAKAKGRRN